MPGHYKRKSSKVIKKKMNTGRQKMKIMPVHKKMYGMGHCQCDQMGDGFFGDIVSGIGDLVTFKDVGRSLAAVGSLGLSEGVLAAEKITGQKASKLAKAGATISGMIPGFQELVPVMGATAVGLDAIGHGKKRKRRSTTRRRRK